MRVVNGRAAAPPWTRLQHRRLDLEVAARAQDVAQRRDDVAAHPQHPPGVVVDDEVDVALADARSSGRRAPAVNVAGSGCRHLAVSVQSRRGRTARRVREVMTSPFTPTWSPRSTSCFQRSSDVGADRVGGQHDLQVAALVAQAYEDQLAVLAGEQDPARDRDGLAGARVRGEPAEALADLGGRRRTVEAQGVRVDAGLAQALQLGVADAFLLGQPPLGHAGGVRGLLDLLDLRDQGGGRGAACRGAA